MNPKTLILVVGPTAVGKTAVAIRLAKHWSTEIISADARQVYKELEIGTAKPSMEELRMVKHHFVNIKSIHEKYSAGMFGVDSRNTLELLFKDHDFVIACGGSGLYLQALLEGFDDLPDIPAEVREIIIGEYSQKGLAWLQETVRTHDPDYYQVVDRNNPQRLMRAIEVIRHSGKPISSFRKKEKPPLPYDIVKIGLELERDELYRRIDQRMDQMIAKGLFEEAKLLYPDRHLSALQTVGYQEIFGFLDSQYDQEEAIRLLKRNSRHYAKRQLTWFRRDLSIKWFHPDQVKSIIEYIGQRK